MIPTRIDCGSPIFSSNLNPSYTIQGACSFRGAPNCCLQPSSFSPQSVEVRAKVSRRLAASPVRLETQLQTELENSGRIGIRLGELAERRAVQRSRGARQVGMVQAVEAL